MMRAQCCICSDLFENCQSVNIAAVPCGHTFHEDCLMRWMETSSTCPSCRAYVKRNQIIKRLFFDIREDDCEDGDVNGLHNQIGTLKAQIREKDTEKQELAESRDYFSARFAAAEVIGDELRVKLNESLNAQDVLQRDLRLLRKENAAFAEELKEFRKTQRRLQELQNVETILRGCDSEIQDVVNQFSEPNESSVKQLASLLTVVRREYNKVLADKKVMREQTSKLKQSIGHYHSEARKAKMEIKELRMDLEKNQEALSQVEKDNNENRRKLVHLRNALRYNKKEGSQSFHRALNEDSPNVAYTPPKFIDRSHDQTDDEENECQNFCLSPDLFEDSPKLHRRYLKRKCLEELDAPKLKFANIPTAAERVKAGRKNRSEVLVNDPDPPIIPQAILSILKKKVTGQSNSRAHVSVITRGYDGFGGSETYVHTQGQRSNAPLKPDLKKKAFDSLNSRFSSKLLSKLHARQPQISSFVQAHCHSMLPLSSSSSLSSAEESEDCREIQLQSLPEMNKYKPRKIDNIFDKKKLPVFTTVKTSTSSSTSLSLDNAPKLSSDNAPKLSSDIAPKLSSDIAPKLSSDNAPNLSPDIDFIDLT